jgi:PmbA protein
VTGFNGGNSNPATGNFSYGIEGFLFRDGHPVHPVRELLITGNFLDLWKNLIATADDARPCLSKLIPTLAFRQVDVSA